MTGAEATIRSARGETQDLLKDIEGLNGVTCPLDTLRERKIGPACCGDGKGGEWFI